MERNDFLQVPDLSEPEADRLLAIIDELTVVEGDVGADAAETAEAPTTGEDQPEAGMDDGDEDGGEVKAGSGTEAASAPEEEGDAPAPEEEHEGEEPEV